MSGVFFCTTWAKGLAESPLVLLVHVPVVLSSSTTEIVGREGLLASHNASCIEGLEVGTKVWCDEVERAIEGVGYRVERM